MQTASGGGAVVGVGTPLLDGESGASRRLSCTGNENNSTGSAPAAVTTPAAPATPASPSESINRTGSKTCCFCWCCCCSCSWSVSIARANFFSGSVGCRLYSLVFFLRRSEFCLCLRRHSSKRPTMIAPRSLGAA